MAMVDVVRPTCACCLQADLRLKSVGLVQRSAAAWRCSAFIAWTGWTLAMTLLQSWWQHHKHYPGYYYYYYYYYYCCCCCCCCCCCSCCCCCLFLRAILATTEDVSVSTVYGLHYDFLAVRTARHRHHNVLSEPPNSPPTAKVKISQFSSLEQPWSVCWSWLFQTMVCTKTWRTLCSRNVYAYHVMLFMLFLALKCLQFLPRDATHCAVVPRQVVCLYVCLSLCLRYCD